MAESKNRKNHKQKFNQRKEKQKIMEKKEQQNEPVISTVPVWQASDKIELNGFEFQEIFNFVNGAQSAFQAVHSVLNKNILSGTVKVQFEKRDDSGKVTVLQGEEAQFYQKDFDNMLQTVRDQQAAQPVPEPQKEDKVPYLDRLVNQHGQPYEDIESVDTETPQYTAPTV